MTLMVLVVVEPPLALIGAAVVVVAAVDDAALAAVAEYRAYCWNSIERDGLRADDAVQDAKMQQDV